ncbi:unnamed protein product [Peronospora belbahrii]|uniref:RING-type domain-containing protein n=1 Tax=Peronospora belbahrii TaxID=622444 RepID=A0AAU9KPV4_9STRA|nr:unnamed protein product [Peronospora belbahrii]CAH0514451.1 unnamed protein product [Peronospora belbahrii]
MEIIPTVHDLRELASGDQFEHVVYLDSDTIEFVNEVNGVSVEAQLDEVYALEVYREEIRRAEQLILDEAVAMSLYAREESKLLHRELETDSEGDTLSIYEESKPPPKCTCCLAPLKDKSTCRTLVCGHLYCTKCIATRCRMGILDRSMVPAHCCKREFPSDYVLEALGAAEFEIYERYLKAKSWRSLDLQSDREYANVVRQNHAVQCPGCGVGVLKSTGCNHMKCLNGHEFCFVCAGKWKSCACVT